MNVTTTMLSTRSELGEPSSSIVGEPSRSVNFGQEARIKHMKKGVRSRLAHNVSEIKNCMALEFACAGSAINQRVSDRDFQQKHISTTVGFVELGTGGSMLSDRAIGTGMVVVEPLGPAFDDAWKHRHDLRRAADVVKKARPRLAVLGRPGDASRREALPTLRIAKQVFKHQLHAGNHAVWFGRPEEQNRCFREMSSLEDFPGVFRVSFRGPRDEEICCFSTCCRFADSIQNTKFDGCALESKVSRLTVRSWLAIVQKWSTCYGKLSLATRLNQESTQCSLRMWTPPACQGTRRQRWRGRLETNLAVERSRFRRERTLRLSSSCDASTKILGILPMWIWAGVFAYTVPKTACCWL